MADEFVNFDSALNELKLSAEQLKRLVSEGEIRAVRGENDTMRFRRDEIERLKQTRGTSGDESSDTLTDDLLFDEADDLDVEDEGMATAQISSKDTFVGDDTGMTTAPIPPRAPGGRKPAGRGPKPAPKGKGKGKAAPVATPAPSQVRRTTGRSTRMRQAEAEKESSGIGMGVTAGLIVSTLVLVYTCFVWWDISAGTVSGPTEGISNWAHDTFMKN